MAKILNQFPANINKATLYAMTSGKQSEKMSNYAGETVKVVAYVVYENADRESGELRRILSILTDDDRILSTISGSFIDEFETIAEIWGTDGDELPPIQVIQATSKKGRAYITCGIDIKRV